MTEFQKEIIWIAIQVLDEVKVLVKDHLLKNQIEFVREELLKMVS